jgi:hypothetical protein
MPRVSDLLDRLRPAGTPGPAGAVGVPADRRAVAEQELAPVFATLTATVQEAAGIQAAAADRAAEVQQRTAERAAAVIAQARADVPAERARAAAQVRANAQPELARLAEQAAAQADAVRRSTAQRLPMAVEGILTRVRAQLVELTPTGSRAADGTGPADTGRATRPADPVGAPQ